MSYLLIKFLITALLIVAVSEIAKHSSILAAILASVPLISVMAIFWLYVDTGDPQKVSALARGIFWLVLPSLAFFLTLPALLKRGVPFYASLGLALVVTVLCYLMVILLLARFGIRL